MKKDNYQGFLLTTMLFVGMGLSSVSLAEQLSIPQAGDMAPARLGPIDRVTPLQNTSHDAVSFSWPVNNMIDSKSSRTPHVSESRGYWLQVADSELKKGINIDASTPGVLIMISPLDSGIAINPSQLELDDSKGKRFLSSEALDQIVPAEKMVTAGTPFPQGTSSFRINTARGKGRFVLRAPGLESSGKHYHIHVQEDGSDVVLNLKSDAVGYVHGQSLRVDSRLGDSKGGLQVQSLTGYLQSPGGKSMQLNFERKGKGVFAATLPALQEPATGTGLLETHVVAQGIVDGITVRRNVKTAFAYSVPQARFNGNVLVSGSADNALRADFAVEVGSAGRYEVRGVLYGQDSQGRKKPIMVTATAAWLETGPGKLSLNFDNALLSASAATGPYEVRDLQLMDQSRLGMLHYQEKGFTIMN